MKLLNSFSRLASSLLIVGCTGGSFSLPSAVSNGGNQSLGSGGSTVATPTPAPGATPANVNIVLGVNGHDGRPGSVYPTTQTEAVFKLLDSKNLRTYRFDVDPRNFTLLDLMVTMSKKYNVAIRPMVYPISSDAVQLKDVAYQMAKRYANDIKIWELGNEQDFDRAGAQARINDLAALYKGVKQASDEMNANLKTTINVMACNSDDMSPTARCPGDRNGSMWFLDMAKASGFNFDHISFHYYAYFSDKGYWYDMYFGQMRAMSKKYNTKIFLNETNCADIYQGNTDGGKPGDKACYDSVKQLLTELNTNHKDIVQEITMYELIDEPINDGVEAHFGLMKNFTTPKELFNLVTSFAK